MISIFNFSSTREMRCYRHIRRLFVALVVYCVLPSAPVMAQSGSVSGGRGRSATMNIDPFIRDNALNLWLQSRNRLIVVGRTIGVGPAPSSLSYGLVVPVQSLTIKVEHVLMGDAAVHKALTIDLPVLKGLRTCADSSLASWMTARGSRNVFFIDDGAVNEELGALPATPELIRWLKVLLVAPIPPGTGAVLQVLKEIAEQDSSIRQTISVAEPIGLFVQEHGTRTAYVEFHNGLMTVRTGYYLDHGGEVDHVVTVDGSAQEMAQILTGRVDPATFIPADPEVVTMLRNIAAGIHRNYKYVALIEAAAGR